MSDARGADDPPFVSVLLPVRGEPEALAECLRSLAEQTYPHDRFEVIVADGSDRPFDPRHAPAQLSVQVIVNAERIMSRGLNLAARQASGEFLAIVSAHSTLAPDYLARVVAVARATGADNVGGRVVKRGRSPWGRAVAAATSSWFAVGDAVQHHGGSAGPADSAFPGFIRRAAFDRVAGFDPRLACNEDDSFNARLRALGGVVWFDPGIGVVYRPRDTLAGVFRQHYRYGRWKVAVARIGIPGYLRWRHVIPSVTVVLGGALAIASPFSPLARSSLAAAGALYAALAVEEAMRLGPEHGADPWRAAAVFPFVHAGYGIGFLRGLADRGLPVEGSGPRRAGADQP